MKKKCGRGFKEITAREWCGVFAAERAGSVTYFQQQRIAFWEKRESGGPNIGAMFVLFQKDHSSALHWLTSRRYMMSQVRVHLEAKQEVFLFFTSRIIRFHSDTRVLFAVWSVTFCIALATEGKCKRSGCCCSYVPPPAGPAHGNRPASRPSSAPESAGGCERAAALSRTWPRCRTPSQHWTCNTPTSINLKSHFVYYSTFSRKKIEQDGIVQQICFF